MDDFQSPQNQNPSTPPAHPSQTPPPPPVAAPPHRRGPLAGLLRYLLIVALIISIIINIYLALIVAIGMEEKEYRPGDQNQRIALIDLNKSIDLDTAAEIRAALRRAAKDDTVKGVILVVNSPGGQVAPTALVNKYIHDFIDDDKKPLYAAIEQVGASGAYWIACAADKIYAQTNAMVGSVGVIYLNMVIETTLKEKLGINPVIIKSTRSPAKDHNSPFRMPTAEEIEEIRHDLDTIHKRFVDAVARDRNLPSEQAWLFADGDVYDGPEALEKKLIDQIGFLDNAIDDLAGQLNLKDPAVVRYVQPPSLMDIITASKTAINDNPLDLQKQLHKLATTPRIQALWLGP